MVTITFLGDTNSEFVTVLNGFEFAQNNSNSSGVQGTITYITTNTANGTAVASITGINWDIDTFDTAISANASGNGSPLAALLNQQKLVFKEGLINGFGCADIAA